MIEQWKVGLETDGNKCLINDIKKLFESNFKKNQSKIFEFSSFFMINLIYGFRLDYKRLI